MAHTTENLIADRAVQAEIVRDNRRGMKYPGFHAFVLTHGRPYIAQAMPRTYRRGQMSACFENAFKLARRRRLAYVEGFATRADAGNAPGMEDWCVEPGSDLVIDTTWGEGDLYYGVPFDLAYRRRQGESVLDNWHEGWPLLRATTDESEWRL